jgi:hypothetical protein
LAAATKKAKERGMEEPEEAEPVAQAKNEFGWSGWSNLATPAKKAKKEKIKKPEEPELTSPDQFRTGNIVVVPSLDPGVEQSNACPFRAQHILDGKGWQGCKKCRTVICQMSIQLLHEGSTVD